MDPTVTGEDKQARQIVSAIEALSEGLALFDDEDRMVMCNDRFRSAHPGLERLLTPGLLWPMFVAEASRRGAGRGLEQIDAHLSSGDDSSIVVESQRPGDRWVRLGLHPTAQGGFVLTHSDITEMRAAEEMRAEADDALRELLDACAPQIVVCRIGDGKILYRTPAWESVFGRVETIGQIYSDPARRSDLLADLLSTGSLDAFEIELRRKDGTAFPARIAARILDYHGEDVVVSSIQDMTQLYAQRNEIVRTNQRLFDAIEALDQGFALFNADDRLVLANQRWMDVNAAIADVARPGVSNETIVRTATERGCEPRMAGRVDEDDCSACRHVEVRLQDGRSFVISRCLTSDGGFVLAWRDVTERRAAEAELARRREASHQNEKLTAMGELLAGVAHELNNPLSVVVGHSLMLREEISDPDIAKRIDKISASAERCARIVKIFLAMARERPAKLEPTSLAAIMRTALEVTANGLRSGGIEVETQLGDGLPPVLADGDQIAQVLVNLLVNAGQALKEQEGPRRIEVAIRHHPAAGRVVAMVADNGPGVPAHLRARIFEPFFTTKPIGDGTGVGLALSHRIVSTHGGSIEVGQSPLGGALFAVSLPIAAAGTEAEAAAERNAATAGFRALLVEDEDDVADMIADVLQGLGIDTMHAPSAEEGLSLLEAGERFDIILSDLKMPGMGGRGLLDEIKRRWPHLASRVAYVTGDAMSPNAAAIRKESGNRLLEKPISPGDLRKLVQDLLRDTADRGQ